MAAGARRIVLNVAAGSGARVAGLGLVFLTTPVLIAHLGPEAFGLLTLAAALPASAGLLDLGIGAGLVKHLAEAPDAAGARQVTTLGLASYALLGLALVPAAYALAPAAARLLALPPAMAQAAPIALALAAAQVALAGVAGVFAARLTALHRMDVAAAAGLAGQAAHAVLVLALIPAVPDVRVALGLAAGGAASTAILSGAAARRLGGPLWCAPAAIPRALVRRVLAFGGWMQLNALTAFVNLEADKLLVAAFVDLAAVTPYQIGLRLASLNRIVPFQMLAALMPAAVAASAGRVEAEGFYRETTRYLMLLTLPLTGLIAATADRLVLAWIGEPHPPAPLVAVALGLSLALNNLTGAGTTLARASGRPHLETAYAALSALLNVGLTAVLAPRLGLVGIVAGTVVANAVGSMFFLALFHARSGLPWAGTVGSWLWRLLAATGLACAAVALARLCGPHAEGRPAGLLLLAGYGLLYAAALAAALAALGFWNARERAFLAALAGRLRLRPR